MKGVFVRYSDPKAAAEKAFGVRLRPVQEKILTDLYRDFYHSNTKIAVVSAPTGSGKSLVAMTSAEYLRGFYGSWQTWYILPTIHLQLQYRNDFKRFGHASFTFLSGRGVYRCPYLAELYGSKTKATGEPFTALDCIHITGEKKKGEKCPYLPETKLAMRGEWRSLINLLNESERYWSWVHLGSNLFGIRYFVDEEKRCPYYFSRVLAANADNVITNYDVFLLEWASGHELPVPNMLVFDEAHVLIEKIKSRFNLTVNVYNDLRTMDRDPFEVFKYSRYGDYVGPAGVLVVLRTLINIYADYVSDQSVPLRKRVRFFSRYYTYYIFAELLRQYSTAFTVAKFTAQSGHLRLRVDPVRLLAFVLSSYFSINYRRPDGMPHGSFPENRKVLIMSGTVGDVMLWERLLSLAGLVYGRDWVYLDYSRFSFPPEIRPVYYVPLYPVNRNNFIDYAESFANLVVSAYNDLHRLYNEYYYVRPAIVVHAYLRDAAVILSEYLRRQLRDVGYDPGAVRLAISGMDVPIRKIVEDFKEHGGILVSSTGVAEGVDFKDDLSRLQFIFKAPFPNRMSFKRDIYDFYVVKTIVQMAGRVARSESDFGATFIVDSNAYRHYVEHTDLYPEYYRQAVRVFMDYSDAYRDYLQLFKKYVPRVARDDYVPVERVADSNL